MELCSRREPNHWWRCRRNGGGPRVFRQNATYSLLLYADAAAGFELNFCFYMIFSILKFLIPADLTAQRRWRRLRQRQRRVLVCVCVYVVPSLAHLFRDDSDGDDSDDNDDRHNGVTPVRCAIRDAKKRADLLCSLECEHVFDDVTAHAIFITTNRHTTTTTAQTRTKSTKEVNI